MRSVLHRLFLLLYIAPAHGFEVTVFTAEDLPPLPTLQNLARPISELEQAARDLADELVPRLPAGWSAGTVEATAKVGGGSFSEAEVPTRLLQFTGPRDQLERVHQFLREGDPAVVARISQDGLGLDLRSIAPHEYPLAVSALGAAWDRLHAQETRSDET